MMPLHSSSLPIHTGWLNPHLESTQGWANPRYGETALLVASIYNYLEVLKVLVAAGADVNAQDSVRG